jgi:prophage antirepressor-like protein
MKQSLEKFLEFNGQALVFLAKDGVYWIALKPICEALNVNYDRQYRNVTDSKVFGPECANLHVQVPGKQSRKMTCLPESSIYGWIFTIHGDNPELIRYQKECNDILFNYFHGTITRRKELIALKASVQIERSKYELELHENPSFVNYKNLVAKEARIGKELKEIDANELDEQLDMFNQQ